MNTEELQNKIKRQQEIKAKVEANEAVLGENDHYTQVKADCDAKIAELQALLGE